jgi:ketosteroid isomerase-like protein
MNFQPLILISILLLTFTTLIAQSTDDTSAALTKTLREYDNAWNKKDVTGVSRILADDYVYFSSRGGLTNRKSTLEFLTSPDYKLTFVERSEVTIVSNLSKDRRVAILSSRWKGRGTYGKEEINDDQRCGLVFVMEGKQWKILSEHCTQIVTK